MLRDLDRPFEPDLVNTSVGKWKWQFFIDDSFLLSYFNIAKPISCSGDGFFVIKKREEKYDE